MKYIAVEQHNDGTWWYHKENFNTSQEAEKNHKENFWWDLERPYKIIECGSALPNETLWTNDFKSFYSIGGELKIKIK